VGTLLVGLVPLGIAGAISPVVLMAALAILGGPRPVSRSAAYSLGVTATTVVLLGAGLLAVRLQSEGLEPGPLGSPAAKVATGVVLILAAAVLVVRGPNAEQAEAFARRLLHGDRRLVEFAGAGAFVMITNASTFVVLIAAIHVVAVANVAPPGDLLGFSLLLLIVASPALVPLGAALIGGERLRRRLTAIGALVARYGVYAMAAIWVVFGIVSAFRGATGCLGAGPCL
jgi:hypothetical protein